MSYVLSWEKAVEENVQLIGGKGKNIAKLNQKGFRIPEGGIFTTEAYIKFIRHNNLIPLIQKAQDLSIDVLTSDNSLVILENIQKAILQGDFPEYLKEELGLLLLNYNLLDSPLAVRSSATAEDSEKYSFAGIHETILNVIGLEELIESIKKCFASVWSLRAISYRRKMKIEDSQLLPAIVIMRLIDTQSSGVAFTCNPISGQKDRLLIHANFGLGETLVSGTVDPDEYEVSYDSLQPTLINKRIGRKEEVLKRDKQSGKLKVTKDVLNKDIQVLDTFQIYNLSTQILRIFESIGNVETHQDIEWVWDGKEFFIVQTRPITVINENNYPELNKDTQVWSNANFKDVMPNVQSFLSWSIIKGPLEQMILTPLKLAGYPILKGLSHTKTYNGRAYMNLSALQWEMYDAFNLDPEVFNNSLGGHQPKINYPDNEHRSINKQVKRLRRKTNLLIKMLGVSLRSSGLFKQKITLAQNLRMMKLTNLGVNDLIKLFNLYYKELIEYTPKAQALNTLSGFYFTVLETKFNKKYGSKSQEFLNNLLLDKGNIVSALQGTELKRLAQVAQKDKMAIDFFHSEKDLLHWNQILNDDSIFKKEFKKYLHDFGHRGTYELDISNPRWREDATYLLSIIKQYLTTPPRDKNDIEMTKRELKKDFSVASSLFIKWSLKRTVQGFENREMAKSVLAHLLESIRILILEISNRLLKRGLLNNPNEIFYLGWFEILSLLKNEWNGEGLQVILKERIKMKEFYEDSPYPNLLENNMPKFTNQEASITSGGKKLKGIGVAAGKITGTCKIVHHPMEAVHLKETDILVTHSTDPSWTPIFLRVGGVIMETGGYLSHGAIVAREYGIPAVVNVPGVMKYLKDGQIISIDGNQGFLLIKEK
ncbi:PEP/pyruvate-binding domain-containing protein [Priestia aryabhattai]|uniref:PEP/pyruvate-binding domain-containing protein n=2 Tax=Priestia aryabhattai TaxID=412384 RepID=UPI0028821587|nr:PEP/pyruvate-binding domain-containing protein [Priestia aryabhattai]MDT0155767.1 PEP/pyruvate-binding domain-containing protein [Priestia aryabhattai]